jgi:hypothetical protein
MFRSTILAGALVSAMCVPALAADGMRFHEALGALGIGDHVAEMLEGQPKWVGSVIENGGVESPSSTMTLEDQGYTYYRTCRPHECGMKKISMMVGDDGAVFLRVYGTQTEEQFFGDPSDQIKQVMRDLD